MKIKELYEIFLKYPRISTDSRNIIKDSIYFALKGEKFDGNDFALDALNNGAVLAIVDNDRIENSEKIIHTKNSLLLLQELASFHRQKLGIPIIAITGTNGKTTTKELIASVLSRKYNIYATQGNFNNHIGVPLTLLGMDSNTEIGITEMGANHPKEIASLCEIAKPNYGIITNIGMAHLEGFGSFEGVVSTKGELFDYLIKNNGVAFVNSGDMIIHGLAYGLEVINYGENSKIEGEILENNPFLKIRYTVYKAYDFKEYTIPTSLTGTYNLNNILAAVSVGRYFKIRHNSIIKAIENYTPSNNRSQVIKTDKNMLLLDAYNANPTSMKSAIDSFYNLDVNNKILILGDMLELGKFSIKEHENITKLIEDYKLKNVIFVGQNFSKINKDKFESYNIVDELVLRLQTKPINDKTILIKGSRGIRLEKILKYL